MTESMSQLKKEKNALIKRLNTINYKIEQLKREREARTVAKLLKHKNITVKIDLNKIKNMNSAEIENYLSTTTGG